MFSATCHLRRQHCASVSVSSIFTVESVDVLVHSVVQSG